MNADPSGFKPRAARNARWTGRTRGGWFGNRFFIAVVRTFGLRVAYAGLIPVVLWFLMAAPATRRVSRQYLRRIGILQRGKLLSIIHVYRHLHTFSVILLDRVAALTMRRHGFEFELDGDQHIRQALQQGRGVILVSAHFGSWEVASRAFDVFHTVVNVVAFKGETHRIQRLLDRSFDQKQFRVIGIDGSFESMLAINAALHRGEIVAMHGDRTLADQGTVCTFLGGQVLLPTGPYVLAAVCGVPLVHTFAARRGYRRYNLKAYPPLMLNFNHNDNRSVRLNTWAQQFADRMEQHVRQAPYQWFNFYDFWQPLHDNAISSPSL